MVLEKKFSLKSVFEKKKIFNKIYEMHFKFFKNQLLY